MATVKKRVPKNQPREELRIPMTVREIPSDMKFVPRKSSPARAPESYAVKGVLPAIQRAKKKPLHGKYTD